MSLWHSEIVAIWSFEHNAWWAPGEIGYVEHLDEAGRYPLKRALEICAKANIVTINEAVVSLARLEARQPRPQRPVSDHAHGKLFSVTGDRR